MTNAGSLSNTMFMIRTLFIVMTAAVAGNLCARERPGAGIGYFAVGGATMSIDDLNTRLRDAGYNALSEGFNLIGGGGYMLRISETGVNDFNSILADPRRESRVSIGGFMLNLSLGSHVLLDFDKISSQRRGLVLGGGGRVRQGFW